MVSGTINNSGFCSIPFMSPIYFQFDEGIRGKVSMSNLNMVRCEIDRKRGHNL